MNTKNIPRFCLAALLLLGGGQLPAAGEDGAMRVMRMRWH